MWIESAPDQPTRRLKARVILLQIMLLAATSGQSAVAIDDAVSADLSVRRLTNEGLTLPNGVPPHGTIVAGAQWSDETGDYRVLIEESGKIPGGPDCRPDCFDAEIRAYAFASDGKGLTPIWRAVDFVRDCADDIFVGLLEGTLAVTDVDRDGHAEVSFLYKLSCRTDVSPSRLKLLLYVDSYKYAIRGTTRLPDGSGGEMNVDASFSRLDPLLREFAIGRWKAHVSEDRIEQL